MLTKTKRTCSNNHKKYEQKCKICGSRIMAFGMCNGNKTECLHRETEDYTSCSHHMQTIVWGETHTERESVPFFSVCSAWLWLLLLPLLSFSVRSIHLVFFFPSSVIISFGFLFNVYIPFLMCSLPKWETKEEDRPTDGAKMNIKTKYYMYGIEILMFTWFWIKWISKTEPMTSNIATVHLVHTLFWTRNLKAKVPNTHAYGQTHTHAQKIIKDQKHHHIRNDGIWHKHNVHKAMSMPI